ncbi:branched-chain amino acid ABC transporter permease [Celeribacter indicus]|uniref:Branched-chain amino acid ABC transporter permease n=1 Tax=Celeribacter indicus TaxID=1208324 RepID=A0A0B5E0I1_9RHOB|nr:branched-chain amino acid ABC transporter permease [Celeribacter indicus]AJE49153.1 branched-chain amino acid ABC transporter permease [Celeribacter indicus]SDX17678.1 amino acid/amide ABC transporter membrane protein 2, HAAT family [Celeribacter indicus]
MSDTSVTSGNRVIRGGDRRTLIGTVLILILLGLAPQVIYPVFVMKLMCYALFAATFNLLFGYAGLLSFGHAAFWGAGAYLTAHAAKVWGFGPLAALGTGMVVAAALGTVIGLLAIRRKGIEFAMITLAMAELVSFIAHQMPFTHGEDGIQGVPRGHLFGLIDLGVPANIYVFVLCVFIFGMFVLWRTVHSPFGHVLRAIRDHENRAISLGYDVARYKLAAFVISAVIAALAGGTKTLVFQFAVLEDVSFHLSGQVVLMTLLGGIGRFYGPLAGAAIVVGLESFLATSSFPAPVITGFVFVLCVMLFRRGVIGELAERLKR